MIDLHCHLFMKHGLGWLMRGGFFEPPRATRWSQRFKTKATADSLIASPLRVCVAALYAHPVLTPRLRTAIQRQIDEANLFIKLHPDWVIAKSAQELKAAIATNKRALILALEGAHGIADSAEDLSWLWESGVRIIAPFHLTDDSLGGCALMRMPASITSSGTYLSLVCPCFDELGYRVNRRGISAHGVKIVEAMIQKGFWIDLSHIGDRAYETVHAMLGASPRLWTHTVVRQFHGAERGISDAALGHVAATQGILGLMPCASMLQGPPSPNGQVDMGTYAAHHRHISSLVSPEAIGLGSDFNGGIDHIPGFFRPDHIPALVSGVTAAGSSMPSDLGLTRFLEAWSRIQG